MKIRALVLAGVIGLSAQASNAATDTSCNPFLIGSCNSSASKAASKASPNSMIGQLFAALSEQRSLSPANVSRARHSFGRGRDFGSFMSRVIQINRLRVVGPSVGDDFDEEPIVIVTTGDDSQPGGGVSVVPVPAAGFLLLAGLGGLAMVRRKKS